MGKLLLALIVIIGSVLLYNYAKPEKLPQITDSIKSLSKPTPTVVFQKDKKHYEFVPYWSFTKNLVTDSEYILVYFGIGVNQNGVDKSDQGYKKIKSFMNLTPNASSRVLAVRMIDKNVNAKVLKDQSLQDEIIKDSISVAQEYKFDGLLLDYETSAFAFDSTVNSITTFFQKFSYAVKGENLVFYSALYGDTYFQSRAFDVKKIGQISDKVIIMAYDFSKSRGNPGPNFPLKDQENYGYSFEKMVEDYQRDVDNKKLVVAFGYFGYDWQVDEKGESITNGEPLSTNEIVKDFVEDCNFVNCKLMRTDQNEPSISYRDQEGSNHIIWYEDAVSVSQKIEFLKEKGILETGAWAYSYY